MLNDALNNAITMSSKLKEDVGIVQNLDQFMNDDSTEKLVFVSKNWPSDAKVGCKSSSDLIKFIEMDEQLEKKLQEFEGKFE